MTSRSRATQVRERTDTVVTRRTRTDTAARTRAIGQGARNPFRYRHPLKGVLETIVQILHLTPPKIINLTMYQLVARRSPSQRRNKCFKCLRREGASKRRRIEGTGCMLMTRMASFRATQAVTITVSLRRSTRVSLDARTSSASCRGEEKRLN